MDERQNIFALSRIISVRIIFQYTKETLLCLEKVTNLTRKWFIHHPVRPIKRRVVVRSIKAWGRAVRTSAVGAVGRVASAPRTAAQGPRDLAIPKCTNVSLWWWPRSTPLSLSHERRITWPALGSGSRTCQQRQLYSERKSLLQAFLSVVYVV